MTRTRINEETLTRSTLIQYTVQAKLKNNGREIVFIFIFYKRNKQEVRSE